MLRPHPMRLDSLRGHVAIGCVANTPLGHLSHPQGNRCRHRPLKHHIASASPDSLQVILLCGRAPCLLRTRPPFSCRWSSDDMPLEDDGLSSGGSSTGGVRANLKRPGFRKVRTGCRTCK
jgi:hypothetical protein